MVLLFVVCGWREEAMAGVFLLTTWYILHTFFGYQGYESWKKCKPSCTTTTCLLPRIGSREPARTQFFLTRDTIRGFPDIRLED